jgi:hypothetical protein
VTVSQLSLGVAVQLQFPPVDTEIVPDVAVAPTERVVGEIVTVHDAPDCVTPKVLPPIVSVALRDVVFEFAETL